MSEVMQAKLMEVLGEMATKLGTTAEHLYGVLVVQAAVRSWTLLIGISVALVFGTCLLIGGLKLMMNSGEDDAEGVIGFIGLAVGGFMALGAIVGGFVNIEAIVSGFMNPEYMAIKEILKALGGGR